jgi:hypothetical protein
MTNEQFFLKLKDKLTVRNKTEERSEEENMKLLPIVP